MPAYSPHADKLTHLAAGVSATLILLPFGWQIAAAGCCVAALGREVYGRIRRGRRMDRADWIEAAADVAATLVGGAAVLAAGWIGL